MLLCCNALLSILMLPAELFVTEMGWFHGACVCSPLILGKLLDSMLMVAHVAKLIAQRANGVLQPIFCERYFQLGRSVALSVKLAEK